MIETKQIEKQLSAIKLGEEHTWGQIAMLLDQIDKSGYWLSDSKSFTEWLTTHAYIFSLKPAMLWRYLTSGRYLNQLNNKRKSLLINSVPTLDLLPNTVSPEGVELLSKIERAMHGEDFARLFKRTLAGDVRLSELRSLWKVYRPVLDGKTARGRGVIRPQINYSDLKQSQLLLEATLLAGMQAAGFEWTGIVKPELYEFFIRVTLEGSLSIQGDSFPAVVIVKPYGSEIILHGILFSNLDSELLEISEKYRIFVDYLWIVPAGVFNYSWLELSELSVLCGDTGFLEIVNGDLRVAIPAKKLPKSGSRRSDMISALLIRSLKS